VSEPEGIYQRLGREQQASAQRFMFRFIIPLLCVVGPLFIWADGPTYRSVAITVIGYAGLTAIMVDAWRTRRDLPSFLWTPEQRRALSQVRRQKRR
jgi:hypothetical protein